MRPVASIRASGRFLAFPFATNHSTTVAPVRRQRGSPGVMQQRGRERRRLWLWLKPRQLHRWSSGWRHVCPALAPALWRHCPGPSSGCTAHCNTQGRDRNLLSPAFFCVCKSHRRHLCGYCNTLIHLLTRAAMSWKLPSVLSVIKTGYYTYRPALFPCFCFTGTLGNLVERTTGWWCPGGGWSAVWTSWQTFCPLGCRWGLFLCLWPKVLCPPRETLGRSDRASCPW